MSKGELRKARKQARAEGKPLTGELVIDDRGPDPVEFSETPRGRRALWKWAKHYDVLNGAPESDYDR
mgnify:CR=1 FL=1